MALSPGLAPTVRPRVADVDIDLWRDGDVALVTVKGEIDVSTADQLRECCELALTSATSALRIDMFGVPFMDSTGVAALVYVQSKADIAQQLLVLEDLQPQVRRVFEVTGLTQVFTIK